MSIVNVTLMVRNIKLVMRPFILVCLPLDQILATVLTPVCVRLPMIEPTATSNIKCLLLGVPSGGRLPAETYSDRKQVVVVVHNNNCERTYSWKGLQRNYRKQSLCNHLQAMINKFNKYFYLFSILLNYS